MSGLLKGLTAILGILAVIACLATVGIIGYSFVNADNKYVIEDDNSKKKVEEAQAVPTSSPEVNEEETKVPVAIDPTHVHDYKPIVIKKASCLESGQIEYVCTCGDSYVVDQMSTGHVPDNEWQILVKETETTQGQRIRRCIYCDEIVASESIPPTGTNSNDPNATKAPAHEHLYVATVEREATCTLSGLRKHTCSCGDFYTDSIPAIGHVAEDWKVSEESTATKYGSSQRLCSVCGALLDVKVLPLATPSASASASAGASSSSAASGSPAASGAKSSASTTPSATPHSHVYTSYVVTRATCTERGVRSFVCSCGNSYAESIELDANNHKFRATFVAPTETQQGYTLYTCERCNYNYMDNYILPLTNNGQAQASASPSK